MDINPSWAAATLEGVSLTVTNNSIMLFPIICAIVVDVITASRFLTDDAIHKENMEAANRLYFSHWQTAPVPGVGSNRSLGSF